MQSIFTTNVPKNTNCLFRVPYKLLPSNLTLMPLKRFLSFQLSNCIFQKEKQNNCTRIRLIFKINPVEAHEQHVCLFLLKREKKKPNGTQQFLWMEYTKGKEKLWCRCDKECWKARGYKHTNVMGGTAAFVPRPHFCILSQGNRS